MSGPPTVREVRCPDCETAEDAVIPANSSITKREEDADGKVWVSCDSCDGEFLVHYQIDT